MKEYDFLKKEGFKHKGQLSDGSSVYSHPLHGDVIINKHTEWKHSPHGSINVDDGFEGTTGISLKAHIDRLNKKNESDSNESYVRIIKEAASRIDYSFALDNLKESKRSKWNKGTIQDWGGDVHEVHHTMQNNDEVRKYADMHKPLYQASHKDVTVYRGGDEKAAWDELHNHLMNKDKDYASEH